MSILKINAQVWLPYMKKTTITLHADERKEYGTEDRYSLEPQRAHLTGEFVIAGKFGGHALRHLGLRMWSGREGGREAA